MGEDENGMSMGPEDEQGVKRENYGKGHSAVT